MAQSPGVMARLGLMVSRGFDRWSGGGVIPGPIGADTSARLRWGFTAMSTNGPVEAINRDFAGMVGGLFALATGNANRLAKGMRNFQVSVQYVYEKVQHGEVGPQTGFPMRPSLGRCATRIIDGYPEAFVRALESGEGRAIRHAFGNEPGQVILLFARYPVFTFLVLYSVATFTMKAMFDAPDAQKYALCELAIMNSGLTAAAKDDALTELRKSAPKTTIEYQYYVPLLVPFDGSVQDKVSRRNAAGEVVDNHSVIPSVFTRLAIHIAQSLISEVASLRSFLWLYRDERLARQNNDRETARKYGPEAANRIAADPRYPLRQEEINELVGSGPRAPAEVAAILDGLLRERNLQDIANRIAAARAQPT